ncbi:MAG: diguanylate cyclase [Lachnospiraceae bacterium]|nr:diguanylate cyclase [Lachnospiraceae bacterium]
MSSASMKHVLIVDDDNINLTCARTVLKGFCKVTPTISGTQALHFLENNTPDLILLDIQMPFMDGFEVMRHIRENPKTAQIPVIFLSANANAVTESDCLAMGAIDFIAKPFVPSVLLNRINKALAIEDKHKILSEELNERIREVDDIKDKSQKDVLTGLYNRLFSESAVNKLIQAGHIGTVFMIDMDNFKAINDDYGHIAGDNVLKMMADTLRSASKSENDILCRIGGDEFIAFFDGITDKNTVSDMAAGMIKEICMKLDASNYRSRASISVGIAQVPDDGNEFTKLYNAADKALYYVKQNGKNSFHFYSESSTTERSKAGQLVDIAYLKDALNRSDTGHGAYKMDFDAFHHVYNFINRIVSRSDSSVESVLFTLMPVQNTDPDTSEAELAIEMLEQAIFVSLRRDDISTRYSSRQIFVVLMNADDEDIENIVNRINNTFFELYLGGKFSIAYDFVKMDGKRVPEPAQNVPAPQPAVSSTVQEAPASVQTPASAPEPEPAPAPAVLSAPEPDDEPVVDPNPYSRSNSASSYNPYVNPYRGTTSNTFVMPSVSSNPFNDREPESHGYDPSIDPNPFSRRTR